MRRHSPKPVKKQQPNNNILYYAAGACLFVLLLIVFAMAWSGISIGRLLPLQMLAMLAGLVFEFKKVAKKWTSILLVAMVALVLSFFSFLPGRREHEYHFEEHMTIWPYTFLSFFILLAIVESGEKVTVKLTEGITLMQSMAIIYWMADLKLFRPDSPFMVVLMLVGLPFVTISLYHAFSYAPHSRASRLTLSIWSSLLMAVFAADNIYKVFNSGTIETSEGMARAGYQFLQYFLLGVSSMYIARNVEMLLGFLPDKKQFFNKAYFKELDELKKRHVKRYAPIQVPVLYSLLCILFAGTIFGLNLLYHYLPRNLIIWTVFVIFPILLKTGEALGSRNNGWAFRDQHIN
ncbi:MAG TPA: hypothetical protein PLO67_03790 [Saprospiraceae bacterium]|nr:hypothetical protein [Saprospiraceae bacterium]HPI07344.1 hypothetical protein [Saprospiraceae bacterium]